MQYHKEWTPKRVCIPCALYPMLLYLLYSSMDDIKRTMFIFDSHIHEKIKIRTPHAYCVKERIRFPLFLRIKYWYLTNIKWHYYNSCQLFGLDFMWYLIGHRDFTYLEDCPDVYTIWETGHLYKEWLNYKQKPQLVKWMNRMVFGGVYKNYVGTSSNVKKLVVTAPVKRVYLEGKRIEVVSLQKMWNESTEEKKQYILSIYDIGEEDIEWLKSKPYILYTQPFSEDKIMSEKEKIDLYAHILSKYDVDKVIIKKHPRDRTDYERHIPSVGVFNKICPTQLLDIIGVRYKRAITVSSTSVLSIPYPVEIDYIGNEVHSKLLEAYGHQELSMHNR